jgi:hypothetical protein
MTNQFESAQQKRDEKGEARWEGFQQGRAATLDNVDAAIEVADVFTRVSKPRLKAHIRKNA